MIDMGAIYTDGDGAPIPKPEKPANLRTASHAVKFEYMREVYAYKDRINDMSNADFSRAFRAAMR